MTHPVAAALIAARIPTLTLCPGIDCPCVDGDGICEINTAAAYELLDALNAHGFTTQHLGENT